MDDKIKEAARVGFICCSFFPNFTSQNRIVMLSVFYFIFAATDVYSRKTNHPVVSSDIHGCALHAYQKDFT